MYNACTIMYIHMRSLASDRERDEEREREKERERGKIEIQIEKKLPVLSWDSDLH